MRLPNIDVKIKVCHLLEIYWHTPKCHRSTLIHMPNPRKPKKTCVEDCLCLWIHRMPKGRNILRWRQGETEIASLEYERTQDQITFRTQTITMRPKARSVGNHRIALETGTPPDVSGQQWLRCECGQRFSKLFLPAGKNEFRCRYCHNLTHHSAQTHNGYMARVAQHPERLTAAIQSSRQASQLLGVKSILIDW
jgi:hypothetical protein